jgi:hypothetical protein
MGKSFFVLWLGDGFHFWTNAPFRSAGAVLGAPCGLWQLIGFAIHHIYSSLLMDIKEKNGTLSSICSGYKFISPGKY